jgi:hypothetical protein
MWTYLLGPFLAIFPKRWRKLLPFSEAVRWGPATVVSGLAEAVLALIGLSYWYMSAMTAWTDHAVATALSGKMGPEISPQEIGSVALVVWASHPLTWLLGYVGLEGTVRMFAAFSDTALGILPFFLLDAVVFGPFRRRSTVLDNPTGSSSSNPSFVGAMRERMLVAGLRLVPDELRFKRGPSGEFLEIHACRRKDGWIPPRVVRYGDHYYRLEADLLGATPPRPFRYTLRKLPAGVPGRSVLLYSPDDAVVTQQR